MHPSLKQEVISAPLPAALSPLTEGEAKPAKGEAQNQVLELDSVKVGGDAALTSLQIYLSKLQNGKAEYEREIWKVESMIRIYESSE